MSSRHLQVLPNLRSTASKLRRAAAGKENADSNAAANKQSRSKRRQSEKKGLGESDENYISPRIDENRDESCETPKSDKNKIPQTLTCPAAPKKPVKQAGVMACKRKLMPELEFFEADRREEVDEFFRASSPSPPPPPIQKEKSPPIIPPRSLIRRHLPPLLRHRRRFEIGYRSKFEFRS